MINKSKQTKRALTLLLCFIVLTSCLSLSGCIRFKPYITSKSIGSNEQKSASVSVTVKNPTNKAMVCTVTASVHWKWGGGMKGVTADATGSREITVPPKDSVAASITVTHNTDNTSREVKLKKVTISSRKAA